jgi:hypothetical protein
LTYEPLHICIRLATGCLPSDAHRSEERCPSNSEADTHIIGRTLVSRYAAFDPSKGPNRPHISSVTSDFKERGRQNQPAASSIAMTRPPACSRFLFRLPGVSAVSVCRCSVVRFGEAVFTDGSGGPQELFCRKMSFFSQARFFAQNLGVSAMNPTTGGGLAKEDCAKIRP